MKRKYAYNENGERYYYSEQDRKEIMRGTSWLNPKYLNYTVKEFQTEMKRITKLLRRVA